MIVRSEYSFRQVFGTVKEVIEQLPSWGGVLADDGCWGHVPAAKEAKLQGKHLVLGCRFTHGGRPVVAIPHSPAGLKGLYGMVADGFDLARAAEEDVSLAIFGQSGANFGPRAMGCYVPGLSSPAMGFSVATGDNLFPTPGDRILWNLMLGRVARQRAGSAHILSPQELVGEGATREQVARLREVVETSDTPLPVAENIKFPVPDAHSELVAQCEAELIRRGLAKEPYRERLTRELRLIAEKNFADYFLVIGDMLQYAKKHMLVGPARGSSCGSLVCWLMRITEVDPIIHDLIFERFIDVNRFDLPDIDIDFPDTKRHMVIEYLGQKYGQHNVAHIGNIIRYKAKSALTDVAKEVGVPLWELDKLKDVMIERSSGDMRSGSCLADSMNELDVGRELLKKYPVLEQATRLENHARSSGVHAAGIIVCNRPVSEYCGLKDGVAQLDKKMAEAVNMLKIDALGLRTLSVIEECCGLINKPIEEMYSLPLDDKQVFKLINEQRFSGVFQFEGIALQSVAKQINIESFNDIAAITALARPGPLSSGETTRWVAGKRNGATYLHAALIPYTQEEYGCIIYQEQVMRVCREIGGFSWADTAAIRKLMSSRTGNEAFAKWGDKFKAGAMERSVSESDATRIWKAIDQMGSWAFNKSHAVAYGIVSYWTAWLKAHHPTEFAVANLRHSRDDDGAMAMLREFMRDGGFRFVPIDPEHSTTQWEFANGTLLGPLTGLKGCGEKTAKEILLRRNNGMKMTARQKKLLEGTSKFENYAPCYRKWSHLYDNPLKHFKTVERLHYINEVEENTGEKQYVVIGKLIKKNLRDLNEEKYLIRRNGRRVPDEESNMLLFYIEDDTGRILCMINAKKYFQIGKKIVEEAALGQWFAVKGSVPSAFRMMHVGQVKWLNEGDGK